MVFDKKLLLSKAMKILLHIIAILALSVCVANAATVDFSYPAEHEQWIDGFVVYEDQDNQAVELYRTTDKSSRVIEADLGSFGDQCRGFFMAPFKASKIGPYSDICEWCPQQDPPETYYIPADKVQGFVVRP